MTSASWNMTEQELLAAACGGDADAFRRLVEPHRAPLHAHCYRMLGSFHDAEDAFQDALLRAWRGLCGFGGRSGLRTWLFRVTTNACLDAHAAHPRRVLPIDDVTSLEDGSASPEARHEQREAVELVFIAALQHLTPRQRTVLVLREVLGLSAKEAAESLGTSVAAVNSAMQRARKALADPPPEKGRQAAMRGLGGARVRRIVEASLDAFERGDVDAIVALLAEDAFVLDLLTVRGARSSETEDCRGACARRGPGLPLTRARGSGSRLRAHRRVARARPTRT
jgi:RNA polymerase sigma-70 factor, ECF subfamily